MTHYLPLADASAFMTKRLAVDALLGLPSNARQTGRYCPAYMDGSSQYLLEIADSEYDAIAAILSPSEISSLLTSSSGYTLQAADANEIFPTVENLIVCDGDSLTYGGTAQNSDNRYPNLLARYLGATLREWKVINFGVAGQQLSTMESDAATQVDPLLTSGAGSCKRLLISWGGANDLTATTLATAKTRWQTYNGNRKAAGWTVAVCTQTATNTIDQTTLDDWNQFIRDNYATYADYLLDLATIPEFSLVSGIPSNPNYADGVHPNDAGYVLIASYMHPLVAGFLAEM